MVLAFLEFVSIRGHEGRADLLVSSLLGRGRASGLLRSWAWLRWRGLRASAGCEQAGDRSSECQACRDSHCCSEPVAERLRRRIAARDTEDRDRHRDSQSAAQLAESYEGPRGLADVLRSDVAHHGALRSGEAQRGSKSEKDQRDDELAVRKVRLGDQAQAGQRDSLDEETRDDERPLAKAPNSRTGDRR